MFYQLFFSPLVKQSAITTYKHSIYELPNELLYDLRPRILGNCEISGKSESLWNDSLVPSLPAEMNILLTLAKSS